MGKRRGKPNDNVSHRGISTQTDSVHPSVSHLSISLFLAARPTVRMRFFFSKEQKNNLPRNSKLLRIVLYRRRWHSRKTMFSLYRASTTCFHQLKGLWSLEKAKRPEKRKKKKTWPGFKNNKSGISISAFKWQKRWRERIPREEMARTRSAVFRTARSAIVYP